MVFVGDHPKHSTSLFLPSFILFGPIVYFPCSPTVSHSWLSLLRWLLDFFPAHQAAARILPVPPPCPTMLPPAALPHLASLSISPLNTLFPPPLELFPSYPELIFFVCILNTSVSNPISPFFSCSNSAFLFRKNLHFFQSLVYIITFS